MSDHRDDPELLRAEAKSDPDTCARCEQKKPTRMLFGSFFCEDCIEALESE